MKDFSKRNPGNGAESARMLVVSREPSALGALRALGEANAWEIEITNSGCEALERVQSGGRPNLVVLDLARGDADGLYTLRWLRRAVMPPVYSAMSNFSHRASFRSTFFRNSWFCSVWGG